MGFTSEGKSQELPVVDDEFRRIALLAIFVNHGKVSLLPLTTYFVFTCAAKFPCLSMGRRRPGFRPLAASPSLQELGMERPNQLQVPSGFRLNLDVDNLAD
jgi:hypothetical protein